MADSTLPDEFKFTCEGEKTIYHAKKTDEGYTISWILGDAKQTIGYSASEINRQLKRGAWKMAEDIGSPSGVNIHEAI